MMTDTLENQAAVRVDAGRCVAEPDSDYSRAVAEIERLEKELAETKQELDESLNARNAISERLTECADMLDRVESQLKSTDAALSYANQRVTECVVQLRQENRTLKLSGDMWLNRSISLKFDLLVANDVIKKIEAERDLALSKMTSPGGGQ